VGGCVGGCVCKQSITLRRQIPDTWSQ